MHRRVKTQKGVVHSIKLGASNIGRRVNEAKKRITAGFLAFIIAWSMTIMPYLAMPTPTAAEGEPTVTTHDSITEAPKDDFLPEETVLIKGTNFPESTDIDIQVIRPDDTMVTGDGTFTPGYDTITTDSSGNFSYYYILDGIVGTYYVDCIQTDTQQLLAWTIFTDDQFHIEGLDKNGTDWKSKHNNPLLGYSAGDFVQYRAGIDVNIGDISKEREIYIDIDYMYNGTYGGDYLDETTLYVGDADGNPLSTGYTWNPPTFDRIRTRHGSDASKIYTGSFTAQSQGSYYIYWLLKLHQDSDQWSKNDGMIHVHLGGCAPILTPGPACTNNPPTAEAGGPYSGDEGSSIGLDGSGSSDPDPGDTLSYAWDLDNNGTYETPSQNVSNTWNDNGTYTVGLEVTDNGGLSSTDTATVTVNDLSPTAALSGDTNIDQGETGSYDALASASSPDAITSYEWDWDYTGSFTPSGDAGATQTHSWSTVGIHTVAVQVTDDDGSTDIATLDVTVNFVDTEAPVAEANGPYTGDEGSAISFDSTGSTDNVGIVTYEWDFNYDGTFDSDPLAYNNPSPTHTYLDNGSYTVALRVTDAVALSDTDTAAVTVNNVAPTVYASNDGPKQTSAIVTVTASQTDPGMADTFTYSFDWNNDGTYEIVDQASASAQNTWSLPGTYTVKVKVTDDDGGTGTATTDVSIYGAEAGALSGNEGSPITFDGSGSIMPGNITLYEWDFDILVDSSGNGVPDDDVDAIGQVVSNTYYDDGTYTAKLTVYDDLGTPPAVDYTSVIVYNVAPTANAGGPYSGAIGVAIDLSGSATDPAGANDPLTYAWDLDNNGTYETSGQNVSNTWGTGGTYTIGLQVSDDDGGVGTDTASVDVIEDAPPAPPTGLAAVDTPMDQGGSLDISWNANSEPDLAGYKLFRSETQGGPYSLVQDVGNSTSHVDTGLTNGATYYYVATAYDIALNESGYSAEAPGIPIDNLPPDPPTGVTATQEGSDIRVDWNHNTEPDLAGYNVFRYEVASEMRVEDSDQDIDWNVPWTQRDGDNNYSGGGTKYLNMVGATSTFTFTGVRAQLLSCMTSNRGIASITVDNGTPVNVDMYSPTTQWQTVVFDTGVLSDGTHTLKVEIFGSKNPSSLGYYVDIDAVDVQSAGGSTTRFEESDFAFTWTGPWLTYNSANYSGGSTRYIGTTDSTATYSFYGTGVSVIGCICSNRGIAEIRIDGGAPTTVDLYSSTTYYLTEYFSVDSLSEGIHAIELKVTGNKNPSSYGTYVDVDAFDVRVPQRPTQQLNSTMIPAGTNTFLDNTIEVGHTYAYQATALDTSNNESDKSIIGQGSTITPTTSITRYEQTDAATTWSSGWNYYADSSYSGGSTEYSNQTGAYMTFTFDGVGIAVIAVKCYNRGIARIKIDNGTPVDVDLYNSWNMWQAPVYNSPELSPGTHTIRIEVTGTKNPSAASTYVDVDAFDVRS